jgi:hypothetical protein
MKNVTIMIAAFAAGGIAGVIMAPAAGLAHGSDAGSVGAARSVVVSDVPVASPDRLVPGGVAFADNRQLSGSSYFYAPGTGPRCEIRMKRIQGRIYQACE